MDGTVGKNNGPGDSRKFTERSWVSDVNLLTGADDMDMFFPIHRSVSGKAD